VGDREYVIAQSSLDEKSRLRWAMRELGMDRSKEERWPDLPEDLPSEYAKEDREIEDRKPDLGEIEEDTSEL
jgi:hypothetical protein